MDDDVPTATPALAGRVIAVHRGSGHSFSKPTADAIALTAGMGVEGDAHFGARVKHRGRVKVDPDKPNLRQVHLIQSELFDELRVADHLVEPGDLGENITTKGIDLLRLPVGSILRLGEDALIALTGLRNPCNQIDRFQPGLLSQVRAKGPAGEVVRKTGVMAVVIRSGQVHPADQVVVSLPPRPHVPLEPV